LIHFTSTLTKKRERRGKSDVRKGKGVANGWKMKKEEEEEEKQEEDRWYLRGLYTSTSTSFRLSSS
jgi:hypothetical protein